MQLYKRCVFVCWYTLMAGHFSINSVNRFFELLDKWPSIHSAYCIIQLNHESNFSILFWGVSFIAEFKYYKLSVCSPATLSGYFQYLFVILCCWILSIIPLVILIIDVDKLKAIWAYLIIHCHCIRFIYLLCLLSLKHNF